MTQQINEQPITLVDSSWPGKELFDITHFNGKAVVKLNHRHPFIKQIYNPIKEAASQDPSTKWLSLQEKLSQLLMYCLWHMQKRRICT